MPGCKDMRNLNAFGIFSVLFLYVNTVISSRIDLFDSDHICNKIACEKLDASDCTGGYPKKIDSLCGCEVCVKYVGKGEKCEGTEIRVECKGGLKCGEDGKCVDDTKCESDLHFKKSLMQKGTVSEKSWLPVCTTSGLYRSLQFVGSKAICVDDNGGRLFGQEQKDFADNMTCGCSYYVSNKKENLKTAWANGPVERCNQHGNYDSLQCVNEVCYCADQITGKAVGLVTYIRQWKLLPCYNAAKHGDRYESLCEKEMFRINSIKHQFSKKGIYITGITLAECEPDGSFAPKQCQTNICYCVDEKGYSFDVYKAEKDRSHDMNCRCARDKYLIQRHHIQYPDLRCEANGNYSPLQQVEEDYFCCDEEGAMIVEYEKKPTSLEEAMEKCMNVNGLLNKKLDAVANVTI